MLSKLGAYVLLVLCGILLVIFSALIVAAILATYPG